MDSGYPTHGGSDWTEDNGGVFDRTFYFASGVALFACIAILGCGPARLTKQQMQGAALYESRCAHCHRDNDLGLKKVPPDLHGLFNKQKLPSGAPATDAEVGSVVQNGRGMMPGFYGRFDEQQMKALLAYLHTGLR